MRMTLFIQCGEPSRRLERHHSSEANPRASPPTPSSNRVDGTEPLSAALAVAGAEGVPQHEFRIMDSNGDLESPIGRRAFPGMEIVATSRSA